MNLHARERTRTGNAHDLTPPTTTLRIQTPLVHPARLRPAVGRAGPFSTRRCGHRGDAAGLGGPPHRLPDPGGRGGSGPTPVRSARGTPGRRAGRPLASTPDDDHL